jgi:hypothetical protein
LFVCMSSSSTGGLSASTTQDAESSDIIQPAHAPASDRRHEV